MPLQVTDREGSRGGVVRTLTLSRPERRNALDAALMQALEAACAEVESSTEVRVLVVTGEGSAFCAGYDLTEGVTPVEGANALPDALVSRVMQRLRTVSVPTIAAVNGPAFGAGLELAISCDFRVAVPDASFCLPPARLGIAYAPEGLARLVSLVGTAVARRMVFSAEVVPAERARDAGLVFELVSGPEELLPRAHEIADRIAESAPLAVRAMKRTFNAIEGALPPDVRHRIEEDRRVCFHSADAAEGVAAFAERRAPLFRGQ